MITILMTVYNGEKYLEEQIESILEQTFTDWKLVIQDDCSTDRSPDIVRRYTDKLPDKIFFVQRKTPSGSAKNNFFSMLRYADSDYIMTCDQDDIWLPDKIQVTLRKMVELEKRFGVETPLLVHTDLRVVDSELNVLSDSLFKYQNMDAGRDKIQHLLVQNIVTGSTVMLNCALVGKVKETPQFAIMHDWWFALIAASFGKLGFVDQPTVLYRQHKENEVGAKNVKSLLYVIRKFVSITNASDRSRSIIDATYSQAESFIDTFKSDLPEDVLLILKAYVEIRHYNKIKRLRTISKYDFWKTGLIRRIGQVIFT